MSKYFKVESKALAYGIFFITNEKFMIFNKDDGKKVYTFEYSENVIRAFNEIKRIKYKD